MFFLIILSFQNIPTVFFLLCTTIFSMCLTSRIFLHLISFQSLSFEISFLKPLFSIFKFIPNYFSNQPCFISNIIASKRYAVIWHHSLNVILIMMYSHFKSNLWSLLMPNVNFLLDVKCTSRLHNVNNPWIWQLSRFTLSLLTWWPGHDLIIYFMRRT